MKEFLSANSENISYSMQYIAVILISLFLFFFFLPREKYEKDGKKKRRLKKTARFDILVMFFCMLVTSLNFYGGLYLGVKYYYLIPDPCPFWLVNLLNIAGMFPIYIVFNWFTYSPLIRLFLKDTPRLKKYGRSGICGSSESPSVPDILDSDTGGGTPDRSLHHD